MFYQTFTQRKNPYIPYKELYNIKIKLANLNSLRRRICGMRVSASPTLPRDKEVRKGHYAFSSSYFKGRGGGGVGQFGFF